MWFGSFLGTVDCTTHARSVGWERQGSRQCPSLTLCLEPSRTSHNLPPRYLKRGVNQQVDFRKVSGEAKIFVELSFPLPQAMEVSEYRS
jgi:hypothetical protein